jgi:type I restriction-modification system DNA methylase subunit
MANGNNTASNGFEQQIWSAADILRGNMDAAEYKHVVLGLIFLKYISDKFEERYRELEADNDDVASSLKLHTMRKSVQSLTMRCGPSKKRTSG